MLKDYIEEIDFSVCLCKPNEKIPWKKIIEKTKGKKKTYNEKDYAFGIYQILPIPDDFKKKERQFFFSEFACK